MYYSNKRDIIIDEFMKKDQKLSKKSKEVTKAAVLSALEDSFRDFNFRTLEKKDKNVPKLAKGETITAFWERELHQKVTITIDNETITDSFVDRFVDYFTATTFNVSFDKWHHITCEIFLKTLKNKDIYKEIYYGKAQKIVNMMFKHLYCSEWEKEDDFESYFKYCHMPLDSFTLEWFRRDVAERWYNKTEKEKGKWIKISSDIAPMPKWSNIEYRLDAELNYDNHQDRVIAKDGKDYYHYMFFQTMIRDFLDKNKTKYGNCTPFQIEFYIWREIQVHLAMEALFGQSVGEDDMLAIIKERHKDKISDDQGMKKARKVFKNLSLEDKGKILKQKIDIILSHCSPRTNSENQNGT